MSAEKRVIRDSFPPLPHLDRAELRDTFARLRDERAGEGEQTAKNTTGRTKKPPKQADR
jgi:hypothetical protein